jgi:hypothetical protein
MKTLAPFCLVWKQACKQGMLQNCTLWMVQDDAICSTELLLTVWVSGSSRQLKPAVQISNLKESANSH